MPRGLHSSDPVRAKVSRIKGFIWNIGLSDRRWRILFMQSKTFRFFLYECKTWYSRCSSYLLPNFVPCSRQCTFHCHGLCENHWHWNRTYILPTPNPFEKLLRGKPRDIESIITNPDKQLMLRKLDQYVGTGFRCGEPTARYLPCITSSSEIVSLASLAPRIQTVSPLVLVKIYGGGYTQASLKSSWMISWGNRINIGFNSVPVAHV